MSKKTSDSTNQPTFQLKGTMLAITVFELAHFNIERLTQELSQKIKEAPEFFETIPMVLGIDKLDIPLSKVELKGLTTLFKEYNIQLMALRTDNEIAIDMAHKLGLVVLPPTRAREKLIELAANRAIPETVAQVSTTEQDQVEQTTSVHHEKADTDTAQQQLPIDETISKVTTNEPEKTLSSVIQPEEVKTTINEETAVEQPKEAAKPLEVEPSKIVTSPVRSGQQIEANNRDLIVTSNVSTGAELITDGNIHIYGVMRGRAMAGYHGNNKARVFCHKLTAELISIAGQVITEEELRRHPLWGKAAQVSLENNQITISAL